MAKYEKEKSSNKTTGNKYVVAFVPRRGTDWKGEFVICLNPKKYHKTKRLAEEQPTMKDPMDFVSLGPGDGLVVSQDLYDYYMGPYSGLFKDPVLVVNKLESSDKYFITEPGVKIDKYIVKDESWSIPATSNPEVFHGTSLIKSHI